MILEESIRHEKEVAAAAATPEAVEARFPAVIADKEEESRFGTMLKEGSLFRAVGLDPADVGNILADPEHTAPGDLVKIEKARSIYAEQVKHAREIAASISTDNIAEHGLFSPELTAAMNSRGKDAIVPFIQKQLLEISASDPTRFQKIWSDHENRKKYTESASSVLKDQFQEICKRNKVEMDENAIAKILNNPDAAARHAELYTLARDQFSMWRSIFGNSNKIADEFEALGGDVERSKDTIRLWTNSIGTSIGMMMNENDDVRTALMLEITGRKSEQIPPMTFKDTETFAPKEVAIDAAWEAHKKATPNWNTMDPVDKAAVAGQFEKQYMQNVTDQMQKRGGGFWSGIMLALLKAMMGKKTFD